MFSTTRVIPFSFHVDSETGIISPCDNHIQRHLSNLEGVFTDEIERKAMLEDHDTLVYEVYERNVPNEDGHLMVCTSITYPGKVGGEFFMTKGHFHQTIQAAECYYGLRGRGVILMESDQGDCREEQIASGLLVYVPPYYAHRSINTGKEPLISLCVYPGSAGHDYATIEKTGFRKRIFDRNGQAYIQPV